MKHESELSKNSHKIIPDNLICILKERKSISFISSKLLCKRTLKWYERFAKFIGVRVVDEEYAVVHTSDGVLDSLDQDLYEIGVGKLVNLLHDQLLEGETVYSNYLEVENELVVSRITHTNSQGVVINLPFNMVRQRATQLGIESVELAFFGKAREFFAVMQLEISAYAGAPWYRSLPLPEWQERLVDKLKEYPSANILRVEGLYPETYKI